MLQRCARNKSLELRIIIITAKHEAENRIQCEGKVVTNGRLATSTTPRCSFLPVTAALAVVLVRDSSRLSSWLAAILGLVA